MGCLEYNNMYFFEHRMIFRAIFRWWTMLDLSATNLNSQAVCSVDQVLQLLAFPAIFRYLRHLGILNHCIDSRGKS